MANQASPSKPRAFRQPRPATGVLANFATARGKLKAAVRRRKDAAQNDVQAQSCQNRENQHGTRSPEAICPRKSARIHR
jgi:hypothetical protein